jgi:hypothetical protein
MNDDERIERLRAWDAGDDEAVYDDIDLESLPAWWQQAVDEHNTYGLRPYRPPRFTDGVLTPPLIDELEATYGVDIKLIGLNPTYGDNWTIYINNEEAFTIARRRDPNGYTVFEQSSEAFVNAVEETLDKIRST